MELYFLFCDSRLVASIRCRCCFYYFIRDNCPLSRKSSTFCIGVSSAQLDTLLSSFVTKNLFRLPRAAGAVLRAATTSRARHRNDGLFRSRSSRLLEHEITVSRSRLGKSRNGTRPRSPCGGQPKKAVNPIHDLRRASTLRDARRRHKRRLRTEAVAIKKRLDALQRGGLLNSRA